MVTFCVPGIVTTVESDMALNQDALNALHLEGRGAASPGSGGGGWFMRHRVAIGAVVVLALLAGYFLMRGKPLVVDTVAAAAPPASGQGTLLNASGYVVARRVATVASKVTGRLIEVDVDEGAEVQAGQVLARLDPVTVTAGFDVARRQQEAAARDLKEIEVRLEDARRMFARNQELKARSLIAQSVLDTSGADMHALEARLEAARAQLAVAASVVHQRQQDLDDLVIRAPFSGVAISKDAQPGEMVSPISAGGGFTRTGIATIVDMDSRELEVDVNEAFIHLVHPQQPVEATLDAYPDAPLPAHVIKIVPTADRQKATIKVRIAVNHLESRILPDMGVKVRFLAEPAPGAARPVATLPEAAVLGSGAGRYVWVVEGGRARRRNVEAGAAMNGDVPIASGLKAGDLVIAHVAKSG
jgi:RND family efflux transporter MFP subunit